MHDGTWPEFTTSKVHDGTWPEFPSGKVHDGTLPEYTSAAVIANHSEIILLIRKSIANPIYRAIPLVF